MSITREKKPAIQLADHFTYRKLIQFTLPTIGTMIFASIYSVVDGFFVSNYAGTVPFAALNLIMPLLIVLAAIGFVFGAGGTALVSMTLGTGNQKRANEIFSLIVYVLIILGTVLSIIGYILTPQIARLLGATDELMPYCVLYARINMFGNVPFMLQHLFQSFFVTAEKPRLGLRVMVAAGVTNMVLDWLFVGVLGWGLGGAAWATVIAEVVGAAIPVVYFFLPNPTKLRLGRTHWDGKAVLKTCTNGSSEFLSNVSASVIGMLYNYQLLSLAGKNGVAAYGVIMYVNFIFVAIYFGYAMGVSPVIGYQYGAQNTDELKSLFRKTIVMTGIAAGIMLASAEIGSGLLVRIFVGYDPELYALTVRGFRIYSIAFLFMGFNIFGSALFTSLNNGLISAFLSFMRAFVLELIMIYLMPYLFGVDGLWMVIVAVEGLCLLLTVIVVLKYRKKYQY
ncbi:MAG: MATE family efflux transporter [Eubacterium sp.]|nr:MATE family efflux transporter [Eubacterium sp.]